MDGCAAVALVDQEWMGVQRRWWIRNGWVYCDFGGSGMDGCTATLVDQECDGCSVTLVDQETDQEWKGVL